MSDSIIAKGREKLKGKMEKVLEVAKDKGVIGPSLFEAAKSEKTLLNPNVLISAVKEDAREVSMRRTLEEIDKKELETKEKFNVDFDGSRKVVANLKLSQLIGQNLCSTAQKSPYLIISLEHSRKQTERLEERTSSWLTNGSNVEKDKYWNWDTGKEFSFDVTDIAADLCISIYAAKSVGSVIGQRRDICVGKVIVPLIHLLDLNSRPGRIVTFASWFEIFPLNASDICYTPVVEGIPRTGMPRPKHSIGILHVHMELELKVGVLSAYTMNPPYRPVAGHVDDAFNPIILRLGANRLKKLKQYPPSFLIVLNDLLCWHEIEHTIGFLCFCGYMLLQASLWEVPLLVSMLMVYLGYKAKDKPQQWRDFIVWNDEIEIDPDLPDTVWKKLKAVSSLIGALQQITNTLASNIERAYNTLNWTDPFVSLIFSVVTVAVGFLLSLVVGALVYVNDNIVPFRHLMFYQILLWTLPNTITGRLSTIGLWLFSPLTAFLNSYYPNGVKSKEEVQKEIDATKYEAALDSYIHENDEDVPIIVERRVKSNDDKKEFTVVAFFKNLFARIPDENEIVHRKIAKKQILPVKTGILPSVQ